jgi:hypothetical protein
MTPVFEGDFSDEEKEVELKKKEIEEQELEKWYKLCSTCGKPPTEYGQYPCGCKSNKNE